MYMGISAFKAMFDMAKGLKDISDATLRNNAIMELQEKILAAQAAEFELIKTVQDLEKKVASFETWEREKQHYELKSLGFGALAYMLKPTERGINPPHWVCTHCFENGKKHTMQYVFKKGSGYSWTCPACHNDISPQIAIVNWID
jgi:hypothetical protein